MNLTRALESLCRGIEDAGKESSPEKDYNKGVLDGTITVCRAIRLTLKYNKDGVVAYDGLISELERSLSAKEIK